MKCRVLLRVMLVCVAWISRGFAADLHLLDLDRTRLVWGVRIPMRDGIHLSATVYIPKAKKQALCIFTLTPYIADSYHERGVYFADNGYTFLAIDTRGRGNSEGEFRPFIQESNDGYDIVEWLAQQPYCNGKVAMWGGSYAGYDQWVTAGAFPPHLVTIVPVAAPFLGTDFPMRNNIFYPYIIQWLTYTRGRASQTRIFNDDRFWSSIYRTWFVSGRSFRDLDSAIGISLPIFQEWLAHPQPDSYWDAYNPTREQYAKLRIPILTITGSNDDDQIGALEHYRSYMRNASPDARARHYLVIGPWDHAGTRTPNAEVGGLKFGPASLIDLNKLHLDWYAWTSGTGPRPAFLKGPVAYYVMGAEEWRYTDTLDSITARTLTYFLDSPGAANDVFSAGGLVSTPSNRKPDHYRFDPREVETPETEAEANADGGSLIDQSVVLALRGKELVYHSEPFLQNTEVSGFFKLSAWIAIDRPDTDIYVSVYDVGLDGTCVRLTTDAIRARYRENLRVPRLIQTRAPLHYDFNRFTFVSRMIQRGHRLRLVIGPMGRLIQSTFSEKNYNTAGEVASETSKEGMSVTVTLYHNRVHPSELYVPIGGAEGDVKPTAAIQNKRY